MASANTSDRTDTGVPTSALCLGCGYALRGLPEPRCPECGKVFDAHDPASYWETDRPRSAHFIWKHWAEPPPLWHSVLCIVAAICFAEYLHFSGALLVWHEVITILCLALLAGLTMSQFLRRTALRICWWSPWNRPAAKTRGVSCRWLVLPICLLYLMSSPLLPPVSLPFMVLKAHAMRKTFVENRPQLIGLLPTSRICLLGDGSVKFQICSGYAIIYHPWSVPLPPSASGSVWRYYVKTW